MFPGQPLQRPSDFLVEGVVGEVAPRVQPQASVFRVRVVEPIQECLPVDDQALSGFLFELRARSPLPLVDARLYLLEAHLSCAVTQHHAESELRSFCDLGIASSGGRLPKSSRRSSTPSEIACRRAPSCCDPVRRSAPPLTPAIMAYHRR